MIDWRVKSKKKVEKTIKTKEQGEVNRGTWCTEDLALYIRLTTTPTLKEGGREMALFIDGT